MNKIFRVIWSRAKEKWVVVAENVTACGARPLATVCAVVAAALLATATPALALDPGALPTGGKITAGSGSIATSGSQMTIKQSSQQMIANWQTFNIGQDAGVRFNQPDSSASALNRITGQNPSQILGSLSANGRVFLLNPSGIVFGKSATVNVGGIVASSLDMSDKDFLAGKYRLTNSGAAGSVLNQGSISAASGGVVALIAPQVANEGTINTPGGSTVLAAGDKVSLDFAGDGLISYTVDEGAIDALAENKGLIRADGGLVVMTAKAASTLKSSVVNNTGIVQAQTLENKNGRILLVSDMQSGTTTVGGTLDASAPNGGDGGSIETSGAHVQIGQATIDAGPGGQWLVDPLDLTIDSAAASAISTALDGGTSVTEETTATGTSNSGSTNSGLGDINVDAAISWTGSNSTLTLSAYHSLNINAPITAGGSTDGLVMQTDNNVGGASSGGTLNINAPVTLSGTAPSLSINGAAYTVIQSMTALQNINSRLNGHYALGEDLTDTVTTGAGYTPIGNSTTNFTGTFEGLGHTISGLYINQPSTNNIGLFGVVGTNGTVRNVGLVGGSVTASGGSNSTNYVGGLVGYNAGGVYNAYATGSVKVTGGAGSSNAVGGVVGWNDGTVSNAYATGRVNVSGGSNSHNYVGGLVGEITGGGTITDAYATGSVTVTGGTNSPNYIYNYVGGLAGFNLGTISDAYATGSVTVKGGTNSSNHVGGVAGFNDGTVSKAYWDSDTTGMANGYGANTGSSTNVGPLTTSQALQSGNYTGFDFTNTWFMVDGSTRPFLRFEYSTTIANAHQLQLMDMDTTTSYTLANDIDLASSFQSTSGMWATDTNTSTGSGFTPIGNFTGTFDGLNHTISNLYINSSIQRIGLFGTVGSSGVVRNVGLIGGSVNATGSHSNFVGELVGYNNGGTISNAYATGSVKDTGYSTNTVGGLVGENLNGTITNTYTTGSVSLNTSNNNTNRQFVGGLVGKNSNTPITNAHATGTVTVKTGGSNNLGDVGGLVGWNVSSTITDAYATGNVTSPHSHVGGLVGASTNCTVNNAYATGNVSGGQNVGGLVGWNYNGFVSNAYATGKVGGTYYVGGLVGNNSSNSTISTAYATGNVSGTCYVGGLVGWNHKSCIITDAYATGNVTNTSTQGPNGTGGLVGWNDSNCLILEAFATGNVSGTANSSTNYWVGGLVGNNTNGSMISHAYWDTTTSGTNTGIGHGSNTNAATPMTTAALTAGLPSGFSPTVWDNDNNQTSPYLQALTGFGPISGSVYLASHPTDTKPYGLILSMTQLQDINSTGLDGNYVLGTDLTDTTTNGSGFVPIGSGPAPFTGTFDGLGYTITDLYIYRPTTGDIGLFGSVFGGTVRNIGLIGVSVTGGTNVGGLVGFNSYGHITDAYVTGRVNGSINVGGLVGSNSNGPISDVYATCNVNGSSNVGGLVGANWEGTISNAYATGRVTGSIMVGGLVGRSNGTISNAYATGSVTGGTRVGGLVGWNGGGITDAYATGSVSGSSNVGGLVGSNSGAINNSFYDSNTTGQNDTGKGTPESSTNMKALSTFSNAGWSIRSDGTDNSETWRIYEGETYPLLTAFLTPLTVTATSGTRVYDGTTDGLGLTFSSSPDTNHLFGSTAGTLASKNVDTYTVTPDGLYSDQQGYDFTFQSGTVTISRLALTGASISAAGSIYGSTVTPGTVSFSNVVGTDDVTSTVNVDFTAANQSTSGHLDAGSYTQTASSTLTGADAGNYSFTGYTTPTANYTVSLLALAGSITAGSSTYGDALAPGSASFTNVVTGDDLGSASVAVDTSGNTSTSGHLNAGSYSGIESVSGLSGADAGNYDYSNVTGDYTVSQLALSGASISAAGSIYGSTVTPGTVSFSNVVGTDDVTSAVTVDSTSADQSTSGHLDAGSYQQTASSTLTGADAGNYSFTGYTTPTANYTVSPLALAGSITTGSSTYGDALAPGSASFTNTVSGDDLGTASVTVDTSGNTSTSGHLNAGSYTGIESVSSLSGADAGNYDDSGVTGDYTVVPRQVTLSASKTYDGSKDLTGDVTIGNLVIGESLNYTGATANSAHVAANGTNYISAITLADGTGLVSNYQLPALNHTNAPVTINAATLTVTANDDSKIYDGQAYSGGNGVTYAGFVSDENSSVLGGSLTYGGTSQGAIDAGSYAIVPGGLTSEDYALAFADGTLTITGSGTSQGSVIPTAPVNLPLSQPSVTTVGYTAPPPVMTLVNVSGHTPTAEGIRVLVVSHPTAQSAGVIDVTVPADMTAAGSSFNVSLPDQVKRAAGGNAMGIKVSLPGGAPLPGWLRYDWDLNMFVVTDLPGGALPMEVVITVDGRRWIVEIGGGIKE